MKVLFVVLCFFLLFIVDVNASSKLTKFSYPASEQIIVVDEIHGHKIQEDKMSLYFITLQVFLFFQAIGKVFLLVPSRLCLTLYL